MNVCSMLTRAASSLTAATHLGLMSALATTDLRAMGSSAETSMSVLSTMEVVMPMLSASILKVLSR